MFYSVNLLRTVAQIALRYYFKEVRGIPEYIGVFAKEKHKYIVEHQKIPTHHTHTHTNTQNRYLKLMFLVLFYVWEDATFGAH